MVNFIRLYLVFCCMFILRLETAIYGFSQGKFPTCLALTSPVNRPRSFLKPLEVPSISWKLYAEQHDSNDDMDVIARRIIVKGDVNGGYVRTCILNEAGRFRKLIGAMSPISSGDTAEIYVEGKAKTVDGFIRWCRKGTKNIGLSQKLDVVDVIEEDPTGLYDGFYIKTGH